MSKPAAKNAAGRKGPTVVSVLNLKGGVGKTTVTALLARYAAGAGGFSMRGQKSMNVLAVDLDPQANLSQALMGEVTYKKFHDDNEPSIVELFNGFVSPSQATPAPTPVERRAVIKVSSNNHSGVLDLIPSRFDFSDRLLESVTGDQRILANFLTKEMLDKDLVLIDCAPTESILTKTAYHASQYVLIPVRTEFFATIGFPLMKQSLERFSAKRQPQVCGVVINRNRTSGVNIGPHHRDSLRDIEQQAEKNGWPIMGVMAHSDGYPKWAKDPDATHLRNAAKEWPSIAEAILRSVGLVI